ncbi:conjugal transfer protein TraG N-terminal domain-containing protein [Paraburkholderia fungorum]|uniref:conjugal transfer protein TraG N-terminal domain-containing protein n=1 Tax=Paraburkholderia fungorum TaxID=134537 RepID=UPI00402B8113
MMDVTISTYWNVETLYYVFNAVAAMMAGAGFAGLLKMVFIFAIGIGMFAYLAGKQLEMATWFFQALVFVTLLNMPIARVTLTDKTNLQPPMVVANVPFAMAVVGQTVNMTFGFITQQYETAFGVPDTLGLEQGDVGFGHRILKQVNNAEIQDPGLRADLLQFIKECTLYDIKDGQISGSQITGGTDVWNTILTQTSPARFVTYNTISANPTTDTCQNTGLILKAKVDAAVLAAQTFYGKQAFPLAQSDALAQSMYMNAVSTSYDWLLQSSQSASDALKQGMFNNMWRQAGTSLPSMLNDPAQVAEVTALAAEGQAAAQANSSNSVMSLLGQEVIPHMRNWIEAILYAMFPVIVILMVVMTSEGAKKVLGGYMMSLAWIGMWPVLFAVINHLSLMYLKHKANALGLAPGVPFQLSDAFTGTLVDEQAVIGYMVVLVPFMAGAIIKMGQGGFMSLADKAITGFSSAGAAAGSAWAAGNVSMGQAGIDTHSVNTTSMHKMDYNMGLEGGNAAIGTSSGGVARLASNGSAALEAMHNRLMTSMATDTRLDSQRTQEAHETDIAGKGTALSNRHSDASSYTDVVGHDNTRGRNQGHSTENAVSIQGSHGGSTDKGQGLHSGTRTASHFNTSAGASDNLAMGLGVGGGNTGAVGGGGSSLPGGGGGAGVDPKEEKRIADSMKNAGASQGEIDKALGNYRNARGGAAPSKGGMALGARLGFDSAKNYSAAHSRDKSTDQAHTTDESTRLTTSFQESGSRTVHNQQGDQSAQTNRHGREAARSNVDEHSRVNDAVERNENGVGNRASRGESNSFSVHHDLMADPEFMAQVAARNGMSAMRFYSQETPTIMRQAQDFAAEKGMVAKASTLNGQTFDGGHMPTTKSELHSLSEHEQGDIKDDIDSKHKKKVRQTGFTGAGALDVHTGLPAVGSDARGAVEGNLNPDNKTSIPARAGAFDENVKAWASPDKKVGEGRANPMDVVEGVEGRDMKDTGKKVWDKLTGGDGTADGEKLNDNKKREDSVGF